MTDFVEQDCTIQLQGRKFTSGGAWKAGDRALVYVKELKVGADVTDWHGKRLGELIAFHRGARRYTSRSTYRMCYVKVRMDGALWYGRFNDEWAQCVRLRRVKR